MLNLMMLNSKGEYWCSYFKINISDISWQPFCVWVSEGDQITLRSPQQVTGKLYDVKLYTVEHNCVEIGATGDFEMEFPSIRVIYLRELS